MNTEVSRSAERIRDHFDDFAPTYHAAAFDGAGMQFLSQLDLDVIARAAEFAGSGQALDVGVGTGRISGAVMAHGFSLTGVDQSSGMLDQARSNLPGATLVQGSLADRLPVEDDQFDLVTCLRVVKYLPNWPGAIRELARAAKPNGVVCFDLANRFSPAVLGYPKDMVHPATYGAAGAAIRACGLEIVEVRNGVHLPDPLWRLAADEHRLAPAKAAERLLGGFFGRHGARSWSFITRKTS